MVIGSGSPFGIKTDSFFNMKDLNAAGIAKLEQRIKAAKETLALADNLQTVRDSARARQKTTSGLNNRILDLYS